MAVPATWFDRGVEYVYFGQDMPKFPLHTKHGVFEGRIAPGVVSNVVAEEVGDLRHRFRPLKAPFQTIHCTVPTTLPMFKARADGQRHTLDQVVGCWFDVQA